MPPQPLMLWNGWLTAVLAKNKVAPSLPECLNSRCVLEDLLGRKAVVKNVPSPASEPLVTYADISKARREIGYNPKVQVRQGLTHFIDWLRKEQLLTQSG